MYEKNETKTTTSADGASFNYKITEKSTSGLSELFFIPIGITLTAVACWLIIKAGVKMTTVVSTFNPPIPSEQLQKTGTQVEHRNF